MKSNRRTFFQTAGLGAAGLGIASALPLTSCATTTRTAREIIVKKDMYSTVI